ncbi:MAG: ketoacyl-ACP synthase III [Rubrobacteraceae bacterium]|uniref:beta-ketoacyl-ACP synthase III n=1 Tax=Rubrobacter naiadicus TaxID=1392641 RepID=UPI00235E4305|nr:beta-ketoacyl-ACP synthase III [Rubrobacter naiadicus]MBX6762780.1 ketoacyl-ACP synthase III [Rubrobacteraceae bacterium]
MNPLAAGRIAGVGRALGSRVVTNRDLERVLDTSDEWISSRTGIRERRFVGEGEDCVSLAVDASRRALSHAGVEGGDVDLVLCATSTAPEAVPSVASQVGEAIGACGVGAMDLGAACAGFAYGAAVAASMLRSGLATTVLLVGVDELTSIVDLEDRATSILFGDGAGAVVLERGDGSSGFVDHVLGADGRFAPLLRAGHPGSPQKLRQNGREVFRFATKIIPDLVEKLLVRNDISLEQVQYLIPHQANARIIQAAVRKLGMPEERVVINVDRYGNTSAASIPISYPDIYDEMEPGRYIITVGFGGGLTWAANLYRI